MNAISSILKFIGGKIETQDNFKKGVTDGTYAVNDVKINDSNLEHELATFFKGENISA
jgi:hypothetical protein|nr:MAG TPA: hypothetical protein [Caudoviricetes sp.]DAN77073.1 MAG TPA: hypothetical protein [Caudoviricetes sp.]